MTGVNQAIIVSVLICYDNDCMDVCSVALRLSQFLDQNLFHTTWKARYVICCRVSSPTDLKLRSLRNEDRLGISIASSGPTPTLTV